MDNRLGNLHVHTVSSMCIRVMSGVKYKETDHKSGRCSSVHMHGHKTAIHPSPDTGLFLCPALIKVERSFNFEMFYRDGIGVNIANKRLERFNLFFVHHRDKDYFHDVPVRIARMTTSLIRAMSARSLRFIVTQREGYS